MSVNLECCRSSTQVLPEETGFMVGQAQVVLTKLFPPAPSDPDVLQQPHRDEMSSVLETWAELQMER